jgi:hypothetical protein
MASISKGQFRRQTPQPRQLEGSLTNRKAMIGHKTWIKAEKGQIKQKNRSLKNVPTITPVVKTIKAKENHNLTTLSKFTAR